MKNVAIVAFLFLMSMPALAQHKEHHHVGIFLGGDSNDHSPIGLEYEYRADSHFGVGICTEFFETGGAEHKAGTEGIIIGEIIYHPIAGLKLMAGPGVIINDNESEYVTRIGTGYDFHWHHLTISPTLNMDFHNNKQDLVYGFGLGYAF
ncbi:hypothetical protein [Aureibacter tunicatorum]|uniref:Opacity protein-like surface antigen n=1 Tax=Aureibacter tunicatorum TaxID=866807 RepID=A0AAE3XSZ8_9BACT|nr:hypothetical protein [Aureibacter tunicatorum]MDR6241455.1 opacity protein-like surface antigen [Aureibacter tunicatorum]BDD06700.1 hypothetical protein AUTU_41830 [Aureibacter tunicatorum]